MFLAYSNPTDTSGVIERDGFTAPDGREIALWRWPRSAGRPALHWTHATGFHGLLYRPLLDELAGDCNVLAWDMRGHGASAEAANLATFRGWETYYRDLTAFLDNLVEPVWLAGHSIGATTSIMAAAARRRREFDSHAVALDNFRGRGGFKTWPEVWLEAYVQHGLVQSGDHVRLACTPEWESTTFAHAEHNPWPGIRRLQCPVIVLAAEQASTLSPRARQRLRALLPAAEVNFLAGTTHFLPWNNRRRGGMPSAGQCHGHTRA